MQRSSAPQAAQAASLLTAGPAASSARSAMHRLRARAVPTPTARPDGGLLGAASNAAVSRAVGGGGGAWPWGGAPLRRRTATCASAASAAATAATAGHRHPRIPPLASLSAAVVPTPAAAVPRHATPPGTPSGTDRWTPAAAAGTRTLSGSPRRPTATRAQATPASAPAQQLSAAAAPADAAARGEGAQPGSKGGNSSTAGGGGGGSGSGAAGAAGRRTQPVDYSTLAACVAELRGSWVPAKVEQVVMPDPTSLCLRLRTAASPSDWLRLCWHPSGGRVCVLPPGEAPQRGGAAECYTLGEQVASALAGRVLVGASLPVPWERVAALAFGVRPGELPSHTLYVEVMARYSNVVLTDATGTVLAAAYQVGGMMSSLRQVQVGRPYGLPPQLYGVPPPSVATLHEWRDTLTRAAALAATAAAETQRARAAAKRAGAGGGRKPAAAAVGGGGDSGSGGSAAAAVAAAAAKAAASAAPLAADAPLPLNDAAVADSSSSSSSSSAASPGGAAAAGGGGGGGTLMDGFLRAFQGVSPALVEQLCASATAPTSSPTATTPPTAIDPHASPAALDERQWGALYGAWQEWQERLLAGRFQPASDPATGRYSVFGGGGGGAFRTHDSVHAMLEQLYGTAAAAEGHGQLAARLAGVAAAALKKARGKVRAFQSQLAEADRAAEVRRRGDLITANLYRIPAGAASVTVEDWDTGAEVEVALDPTQPPVAAAEAAYKKARKLRRAADAVAPLLAETEAEVSYLEEVEVGLAALAAWRGDAADTAALREVQDELVAGGYMKPPPDAALAAKAAARATKAANRAAKKGGGGGGGANQGKKGGGGGGGDGGDAAAARRFVSPGGFLVLVGRNNRQNDVLSTQVAADDDLWLHVRGMPGSHTLLRASLGPTAGPAAAPAAAPGSGSGSSGGRQPRVHPPQQQQQQQQREPGDADIQFAADLAAFYSKAKDALKVDVILTRGAWVRKPRGAKPGAVSVSRELRNVVGRPGQSAAAEAEAAGAVGK